MDPLTPARQVRERIPYPVPEGPVVSLRTRAPLRHPSRRVTGDGHTLAPPPVSPGKSGRDLLSEDTSRSSRRYRYGSGPGSLWGAFPWCPCSNRCTLLHQDAPLRLRFHRVPNHGKGHGRPFRVFTPSITRPETPYSSSRGPDLSSVLIIFVFVTSDLRGPPGCPTCTVTTV